LKAEIRTLFGEALLAWDVAAPVRFTEDEDVWDFEIVRRSSDACEAGRCVLASAFFPDPGRHQLVVYPMLFRQPRAEQVETLIHEIGHIFGLRHFFAKISETAWPSEIFGTHSKFSIMNYGQLSMLTDDDRNDLQRLYELVWRGAVTHVNGTPIRTVRPFHTLAPTTKALIAARRADRSRAMTTLDHSTLLAPLGHGLKDLTFRAAEATLSVTITMSVGAGGRLSAKLNKQPLAFQNGQARAVVKAGKSDNELSWVVVGATGTPWSIGVTEPANSGCDASGTLDADRMATGFCDFAS
jgi:hypothetical protein